MTPEQPFQRDMPVSLWGMSGINWGDAPAWGALVIAGVGGSIALAQLRQQQRVIARELRRSAALEEARFRGQAEDVDMAWSAGNGRETFVQVTNYSRRPIRALDCEIVSEDSGVVVAMPVQAGEMQETKLRRASDWVLPKDGSAPGEWCNVLRAGGRAGFLMSEPPGVGQKALVRFTDDAGLRWQLDNELHLERLTGEPWDHLPAVAR